eukprot:gene5626-7770_t
MDSFVEPSPEEIAIVQSLRSSLSLLASPNETQNVDSSSNLDQISSEDVNELTDIALLRFYRDKYNVEKAYQLLIHHIKWKKDMNVKDIKDSDVANMIGKKLVQIQGFDKNGRPCAYVVAKRHLSNDRDIAELRLFVIFMLEALMKLTKPTDERMTFCFDLNGFGFQNMDYEAVKVLIDVLQKNYPEVLSVAYIIDAPFIFSACWAVIKPWLDPVTAAKVNFIKRSDLINFIDPDQIHPDIISPEILAMLTNGS